MNIISNLRYYVSKLFPTSLKWKLIRILPEINNFTGKFFQGIRYAWEEDKDYYPLYQQAKERSLLDKKRGFMIYQTAKKQCKCGRQYGRNRCIQRRFSICGW